MTDQYIFCYQIFVAVFGIAGGKVPVVDNVSSSHQQESWPTTSHDENSTEFECQIDRNVCVDLRQTYLALKNKLVKGRGFDTYKTTGKKRTRNTTLLTLEQATMTSILWKKRARECIILLMWTIFYTEFFLMRNCASKTTKSTIWKEFMLTDLTFLKISKAHWQITKESCIAKCMTMKQILKNLMKIHFSMKEWLRAVDLTVLCSTLSSVSTLLQHWNHCIQTWKYESDQISTFWANSTLYTRRVILQENNHKKTGSTIICSNWV